MQTTKNIPITEIKVCNVEHVDTKRGKDVHVTLTGIPISHVKEVHMKLEEGNKGLTTMIFDSTASAPSTKDVIASRLRIEL